MAISKSVVEDRLSRYVNRELSWLHFNQRVLEEAADDSNPALERLKFLAIFESNLDEFYMVRVSGLIEQWENGELQTSPDGLSTNDQLNLISNTAAPLRQRAYEIYESEIVPELAKANVTLRSYAELSEKQIQDLQAYFHREVFPLCTPLVLYPAPSVPFISNRSLNIAIELEGQDGDKRLARVKVPTVIPRAVKISGRRNEFVLLEDVIMNNLQSLFPGVEIIGAHLFRVIRDGDIDLREVEDADLIASIEETIRLRRFGDPVLLQVNDSMPEQIRSLLRQVLKLDEEDIFVLRGVLGMEVFWELARVDKPNLKFPPHVPYAPETLSNAKELFDAIGTKDILLHHPYDSFRAVEMFVGSAVKDPNVLGIKQTLYRVGTESPIVECLLDAAEAGKQVAAMVELKARFDESNNLVWARALERAGVHVTYGFADMKVHCKLCLLVRREGED